MNIYLLSITASAFILVFYLIAYVVHCGLPESLNTMYNKTERKWVFTSSIIASSILAYVPMSVITPLEYQVFVFAFFCSIAFISAGPLFNRCYKGLIYVVSVITHYVSAVAWMLLIHHIPCLSLLSLTALLFSKRWALYIELTMLFEILIVIVSFVIRVN